ncbi:hypothetical protein H310_10083 [Aphanomyces invadans]|uniref:Transmembrane protein n=1 Tax=Aphanomyces invadans TaxID=157072 RepID=A0A024TTW1_9STRA|nr:hypothetical protein H310_10083 [Aphanomyces invadans]ETV96777.1 hypothetical protein H310_10083 [Aphanomyces invadans]|eukprot:XP_008874554.1 hypothetical protein H310_10083 [Aphanomyces invadans]
MTTERRHAPRWMWKVVAVCIASGMVGYFLPLLLTESPEQRRATLVTTQTVLLQREHTIRQKFNALKADVAAFEAAVGDIWKVAALRKLREDHMLRESDEHVDAIKKVMVERRADMESLLVDTTRSIRDAISMLRDRTVCPSTEHPSQLDNLGKVPNRIVTVDSPDADPPSGDTTTTSATTDVSSSAHAKAAHPQVTIIAPPTPSREKQTATPSSPSQRPPTSRPKAESSPSRPPREFPITFLQAAMVFFAALVTLVAFSLISEFHRRGGDHDYSIEGFFSPPRKKHPPVDAAPHPVAPPRTDKATSAMDNFLAASGSYYAMQLPHEESGLMEATPVRRSRRLNRSAGVPPTHV